MTQEGAAIWLFRRLRALDLLDRLPPHFVDQLRQLAFDAAARRLEVEAEAAMVVDLLDRAAVPVILIKGVARCALAHDVPYLDARGTLDVDLLVPQSRSAAGEAALRDAGYRSALPTSHLPIADHHHLPPLQRGSVTVELHESSSTRVAPDVAWERAEADAQVVRWAGLLVRVPSVTELAWNAVAHAMEDGVAGFRCSRWLEVAALLAAAAPINWRTIELRAAGVEAFPSDANVVDGAAIIRRWLTAARALAPADALPEGLADPRFALETLLSWRLRLLRSTATLGRAATERLVTEGARVLIGLPREPSPVSASTWARVRRAVAGRTSRLAFHAWRATA